MSDKCEARFRKIEDKLDKLLDKYKKIDDVVHIVNKLHDSFKSFNKDFEDFRANFDGAMEQVKVLKKDVTYLQAENISLRSELKELRSSLEEAVNATKAVELEIVGIAPSYGMSTTAGKIHLTEDGLEEQFATNHLGHFLLVQLLLPLLRSSAPLPHRGGLLLHPPLGHHRPGQPEPGERLPRSLLGVLHHQTGQPAVRAVAGAPPGGVGGHGERRTPGSRLDGHRKERPVVHPLPDRARPVPLRQVGLRGGADRRPPGRQRRARPRQRQVLRGLQGGLDFASGQKRQAGGSAVGQERVLRQRPMETRPVAQTRAREESQRLLRMSQRFCLTNVISHTPDRLGHFSTPLKGYNRDSHIFNNTSYVSKYL